MALSLRSTRIFIQQSFYRYLYGIYGSLGKYAIGILENYYLFMVFFFYACPNKPLSTCGESFKRIITLMRGNMDDRREAKFVIVLYKRTNPSLSPGLVSAPVFFAWNSDTDWGWGSGHSPRGELSFDQPPMTQCPGTH